MRGNFYLPLFILFTFLIQSCNTLYNYRYVNIEVYEPGKIYLPERYATVAIAYNNTNVRLNPELAKYYFNSGSFSDTVNTDSIASYIYFYSFADNLKKQDYFDSIVELPPSDYSNCIVSGSAVQSLIAEDSSAVFDETRINEGALVLSQILKVFPDTFSSATNSKNIDPVYGMYSKEDLQKIAGSTKADLFISFDYFSSSDIKTYFSMFGEYFHGSVRVYSMGYWDFYDLKKMEPIFYFPHIDTIGWDATADFTDQFNTLLPPRNDAVFNAAEMSGENFAAFLIPHWREVERLYYSSGQADLKLAETLAIQGKWMEAAEFWKKNINNPNKNISAKCMFNLAVASEMAGDFDTAIEWVTKSYHVFGNKNVIHAQNCISYISILGKRKLDVKKIERQVKPEPLF